MKLLKMVLFATMAPAVALAQPTTQPDEANPDQPAQPSEPAQPTGANTPDTGMASGMAFGLTAKPLSADKRATYGGPKDAGLLVTKVEAGSAAATAGIKVGDVITKIDDMPMATTEDLTKAQKSGKSSAAIEVVRDHQTKNLQLSAGDKPEQKSDQPQKPEAPKGGY